MKMVTGKAPLFHCCELMSLLEMYVCNQLMGFTLSLDIRETITKTASTTMTTTTTS